MSEANPGCAGRSVGLDAPWPRRRVVVRRQGDQAAASRAAARCCTLERDALLGALAGGQLGVAAACSTEATRARRSAASSWRRGRRGPPPRSPQIQITEHIPHPTPNQWHAQAPRPASARQTRRCARSPPAPRPYFPLLKTAVGSEHGRRGCFFARCCCPGAPALTAASGSRPTSQCRPVARSGLTTLESAAAPVTLPAAPPRRCPRAQQAQRPERTTQRERVRLRASAGAGRADSPAAAVP